MSNLFTPPSARGRSIAANAREQLEAEALFRKRGIPIPTQALPEVEVPVVEPEPVIEAEPEVVPPAEPDPALAEEEPEVEAVPEDKLEDEPENVDDLILEDEEAVEAALDAKPEVKEEQEPEVEADPEAKPEYVVPEFSSKTNKTRLLEIADALAVHVTMDDTKKEILKALEKALA